MLYMPETKTNGGDGCRSLYYGGPYKIRPTVHTKPHIYRYFYKQYVVLLTMAPRNGI